MPATATKERPILFSGPMVRAILEDRKVQTRRIVKPQPPNYINDLHGGELSSRAPYTLEDDETGCVIGSGFWDDNDVAYKCPYGQPGDRLWVRETWRLHWDGELQFDLNYRADDTVRTLYPKDLPENSVNPNCLDWRWKPSIHMPRWASRITLEITDVRVERLQEISEGDAVEEGCSQRLWRSGVPDTSSGDNLNRITARGDFRQLWNSINGPESWDANPWVWVVGFKRITN